MAPAELQRLATGLFQRWHRDPYTFWLDSGCDADGLGRFSFLGTRPYALLVTDEEHTRLMSDEQNETWTGSPLTALAEVARPILRAPSYRDTIPFTGGLVGYLSYDLGLRLVGITSRHRPDSCIPLLLFGLYDALVCIDHREGALHLIASSETLLDDGERARRLLSWLRREVEAVRAQPAELPALDGQAVGWRSSEGGSRALQSDFTRAGYLATIEKLQEAIRLGQLEQANLAQRFQAKTSLSPTELYCRLRVASPAPFGGALRVGSKWILSSSPERLFAVRAGQVETRPIKGTRPRSPDRRVDAMLRRELTDHPKDKAEHLMIVDLAKEELGALCHVGSVHVPELMHVEAYRTVYQLVSTVRGRLLPDKDAIDCLQVLFPGASITGRPKREAMEMIDALEPVGRGVYTGAIGYLGLGGSADFNVAIRTIILGDGVATFHVGGAIVEASHPAAEYEETLDKAEGMVQALLTKEEAG